MDGLVDMESDEETVEFDIEVVTSTASASFDSESSDEAGDERAESGTLKEPEDERAVEVPPVEKKPGDEQSSQRAFPRFMLQEEAENGNSDGGDTIECTEKFSEKDPVECMDNYQEERSHELRDEHSNQLEASAQAGGTQPSRGELVNEPTSGQQRNVVLEAPLSKEEDETGAEINHENGNHQSQFSASENSAERIPIESQESPQVWLADSTCAAEHTGARASSTPVAASSPTHSDHDLTSQEIIRLQTLTGEEVPPSLETFELAASNVEVCQPDSILAPQESSEESEVVPPFEIVPLEQGHASQSVHNEAEENPPSAYADVSSPDPAPPGEEEASLEVEPAEQVIVSPIIEAAHEDESADDMANPEIASATLVDAAAIHDTDGSDRVCPEPDIGELQSSESEHVKLAQSEEPGQVEQIEQPELSEQSEQPEERAADVFVQPGEVRIDSACECEVSPAPTPESESIKDSETGVDFERQQRSPVAPPACDINLVSKSSSAHMLACALEDEDLEREFDEEPAFERRDVRVRRNEDPRANYKLGTELGRGKFGTVFRCVEEASGRELAAKFIHMRRREDREDVEREVAIMSELQHKRLLQLYDAFDDGAQEMCLITELVEGGELFERIVDDDFDLTEKKAAIFVRQICEGVEYMHGRQIVHLDMKPENILCLSRTGIRIKLIDFGLARRLDPAKPTRVMFGTPDFAAPEVLAYETVTLATDMWSVGVICYVLLSGLSPFMGDSDMETMANVMRATFDFNDEAFDAISELAKDFIAKLLVRDASGRLKPSECLKHPWLARGGAPLEAAIRERRESGALMISAHHRLAMEQAAMMAAVAAAAEQTQQATAAQLTPPIGAAGPIFQAARASFGAESSASSSGMYSLDKRRLKRYVVRRKWHKTVHAIMALGRMGANLRLAL